MKERIVVEMVAVRQAKAVTLEDPRATTPAVLKGITIFVFAHQASLYKILCVLGT